MTEFLWPYLSLAFSAFISATLLPFGSELVLVGLLTQGYPALVLWGIATVFNTAGSVLNWYLGRQLLLFQHKSWFMFNAWIDPYHHWFPHSIHAFIGGIL